MANVTIVGGGLAGMTAALRLLERGYQVSIYESTSRLGGKAGADKNGDDYNDHGYHIFPAWYLNTWRLVDELGIRDNFIDLVRLNQVNAEEFPKFTTLEGITSLRNAVKNLRAGFIPIPDMILFLYAVLDLASQPYSQRASLDQISATGFLRSRFYTTERLEEQFHELMLKAITVPSYNVSAMTVKNVMQFWLKYPLPVVRILKGNLQTFFINPIEQRLTALACNFHFHKHLVRIETEDSRVTRLYFRDTRTDVMMEKEVDQFILAIPSDKVAKLIDDELYAAAPELANIQYLHSQPMVSLDVYLRHKIPELPSEHVNLTGARFGLSLIDVSNVWSGYEKTVLNLIASDFHSLQTLSSEQAVEVLMAEIRRFLPIERNDVERYVFQPHAHEPLLLNDLGAWHFRPEATTELENMFLAGDYCRSPVDLASMEAAILSGLKAAEALRLKRNIGTPVEILEPEVHPEWLLRLSRYILTPIALVAKIATLLRR